MARKIIVLERTGELTSVNFNDLNFKYVFWADTPSARQALFADATKGTAVKDASAGEKSAITSGTILETVGSAFYPAGTSASSIKADLIVKFNAFQSAVTNFNPFQYYGTFWDGTTWTNGGVS